mmetsp:Transcript_17405/g.35365  ORF Transcript_17405/g.35365 Transcript_17405/m.35365 type:complete len:178 (-) Transcript_17405:500-1033(-)
MTVQIQSEETAVQQKECPSSRQQLSQQENGTVSHPNLFTMTPHPLSPMLACCPKIVPLSVEVTKKLRQQIPRLLLNETCLYSSFDVLPRETSVRELRKEGVSREGYEKVPRKVQWKKICAQSLRLLPESCPPQRPPHTARLFPFPGPLLDSMGGPPMLPSPACVRPHRVGGSLERER